MSLETSDDYNSSTNNIELSLIQLVGICAAASIIVLMACSALVAFFVDFKLLSSEACKKFSETAIFPSFTYCFYSENWDEEVYLSIVTDFYSILITFLFGLLALVSTLAFVIIKNSNKKSIEEEIEKELPNYFRRRDVDETLQNVIKDLTRQIGQEELRNLANEQDSAIDSIQQELERLKSNKETVEFRLKELEKEAGINEADDEPESGHIQQ